MDTKRRLIFIYIFVYYTFICMYVLFNDADGSSDYVAPNNVGVPFIASPTSTALPHSKPTSVGISRDSCSV